MGRKVHPVGFRLKAIRDWNTRWYAERGTYRQLLHEDFAIRRLIHEELPRAGISRIEIERFPNQVQVVIWTSKPGIVIGRSFRGWRARRYRSHVEGTGGNENEDETGALAQPELAVHATRRWRSRLQVGELPETALPVAPQRYPAC